MSHPARWGLPRAAGAMTSGSTLGVFEILGEIPCCAMGAASVCLGGPHVRVVVAVNNGDGATGGLSFGGIWLQLVRVKAEGPIAHQTAATVPQLIVIMNSSMFLQY